MCLDPRLFTVSPVAARVYAAWQYLRATGSTPTHARIAATGNISESSVSRCMPELVAAGLLTRTWDGTANGGRGGYVLALPSPVDGVGSSPDGDPSTPDVSTHPQSIPSPVDPTSIPAAPPPGAIGRNALMRGRAIMESPCDSQEEDQSQEEEDARAIAKTATAESDAAWLAAGVTPEGLTNVRAAARRNGWTPADFAADLAAGRASGEARTPGLIAYRWKQNRRYTPQEPRHEHRSARPSRSAPPIPAPALAPAGDAALDIVFDPDPVKDALYRQRYGPIIARARRDAGVSRLSRDGQLPADARQLERAASAVLESLPV